MFEVTKACGAFMKLLEEQLDRVAGMKVEKTDFTTKPCVTIGVIDGDGIGPIITKQATRVLEKLLADEIAAGNEDGLDLRVIRYGTTIYLFIENKQVAVCDLTKCANANGDTESGITADTKMYIYLRHYDDLREDGVQIPFSIKTDVTPVEVSVTAAENGTDSF